VLVDLDVPHRDVVERLLQLPGTLLCLIELAAQRLGFAGTRVVGFLPEAVPLPLGLRLLGEERGRLRARRSGPP
jgi:hypothetical protein